MSTRTRARQLAQQLLDEVTALHRSRDRWRRRAVRAEAEADELRRQLAEAVDRDGVLLLASDEEG